MNWGTKLVIGMVSFMTFIIVLGVLMFTSEKDALVENDYYEKGLNYDSTFTAREQVNTDNAAPEISITTENIVLVFKDDAKGKVKLMRTADKRMDRSLALATDQQKAFQIPLDQLAVGHWKLIISWTSNGKAYLHEQEVIVP